MHIYHVITQFTILLIKLVPRIAKRSEQSLKTLGQLAPAGPSLVEIEMLPVATAHAPCIRRHSASRRTSA